MRAQIGAERGERIGLGHSLCHGSEILPAKAPGPLVFAHQAGAALFSDGAGGCRSAGRSHAPILMAHKTQK
ncbi:hypothetical protein GCM10010191_52560 [Actinomadura vinacea]|uniref:Uncharacterized protein n=1 Tax=Actinomadura vinacea TaxID=115336 RepID=A0ABN3JJ98_9ACTN